MSTQTVKIGPLSLPVVSDPRPDTENIGEYSAVPCPYIWISPKITGHVVPMTILHESLHCISETYRLKLKERQVRCLEAALTAWIRDNPELVRQLQK